MWERVTTTISRRLLSRQMTLSLKFSKRPYLTLMSQSASNCSRSLNLGFKATFTVAFSLKWSSESLQIYKPV